MSQQPSVAALASALRSAWAADTSSAPTEWRGENPAWGQCAVTSCVVNDYLGGEVVWAEAALSDGRRISHYFNHLQSGECVDLTKEQFPEGTVIPVGIPKFKGFSSTREYVLSFSQTADRYRRLAERTRVILAVL